MQNDVDDADGVDIDPSCLKRSSLGAIHFFALKTFRAILPHFPSPHLLLIFWRILDRGGRRSYQENQSAFRAHFGPIFATHSGIEFYD